LRGISNYLFTARELMVGENQCGKIVNPSSSDMWSQACPVSKPLWWKKPGDFSSSIGVVSRESTLVPYVYSGTGVFYLINSSH